MRLPCQLVVPAAGFLFLAGIGLSSGEPAAGRGSPWASWHTLTLVARSIPFLSGSVRMESRSEGGKTLFETRTEARLFGATMHRSRTRTIIDPRTGRTEQYLSFSPERGRRFLFGETGYVVEKLRPEEGFDAPIDRWEVTSRKEFAFPETPPADGADRVYDYYGMLLHLRDVELNKPGDEVSLTVATSQGPERYRVRIGESRTLERSFRDSRSREPRTVTSEEFLLHISPADPGEEPAGFLGMRGETEVWVEAETKTLLSISGKIPKVPGRVVLELSDLGS